MPNNTRESSIIKHERKQSQYFKALCNIIPLVEKTQKFFPTVLSVKLTRDNYHLYIYLTFEHHKNEGLAALTDAKGFVRSELALIVNQRITPELHFEIDDSYEKAQRIETILKEIKTKESKS